MHSAARHCWQPHREEQRQREPHPRRLRVLLHRRPPALQLGPPAEHGGPAKVLGQDLCSAADQSQRLNRNECGGGHRSSAAKRGGPARAKRWSGGPKLWPVGGGHVLQPCWSIPAGAPSSNHPPVKKTKVGNSAASPKLISEPAARQGGGAGALSSSAHGGPAAGALRHDCMAGRRRNQRSGLKRASGGRAAWAPPPTHSPANKGPWLGSQPQLVRTLSPSGGASGTCTIRR